ncbi:unnamed protein product, partial [Porites lobata]
IVETLNITVVRCFAWKIAGELDICISMSEYRTGVLCQPKRRYFARFSREHEVGAEDIKINQNAMSGVIHISRKTTITFTSGEDVSRWPGIETAWRS